MIDFKKITDKEEVIKLLKAREFIEQTIELLDPHALIVYELERLAQKDEN